MQGYGAKTWLPPPSCGSIGSCRSLDGSVGVVVPQTQGRLEKIFENFLFKGVTRTAAGTDRRHGFPLDSPTMFETVGWQI